MVKSRFKPRASPKSAVDLEQVTYPAGPSFPHPTNGGRGDRSPCKPDIPRVSPSEPGIDCVCVHISWERATVQASSSRPEPSPTNPISSHQVLACYGSRAQWFSRQYQYFSGVAESKEHLSQLPSDAATHLAQFPVKPQRTRKMKWVFVTHYSHYNRPIS